MLLNSYNLFISLMAAGRNSPPIWMSCISPFGAFSLSISLNCSFCCRFAGVLKPEGSSPVGWGVVDALQGGHLLSSPHHCRYLPSMATLL